MRPTTGIDANQHLGTELPAADTGTARSSSAASAKLTAGVAATLALAACGGGAGSTGDGTATGTGSTGSSGASTGGGTSASSGGSADGGSSGGSPSGSGGPAAALGAAQASRFLAQAAIGHGRQDIDAVVTGGIGAWLGAQFAMARSQKFWDYLIANGWDASTNANTENGFQPMVWSQLMGSSDLLRQRIGLALLDMWVVSIDGITTNWRSFAMAAYMDVLWDNAFGNYRDLMEAVSTSPAMGLYLTFLGSVKANPATGSIPDENYARELMQLFTIGLYELNMDGSQVLQSGSPVPTYAQADVSQHARVWTGYTFASTDNTTPARLRMPMVVNATRHEPGASSFLGISIPAGADAATARKLALDGLFNHPNVPPFVGRQLIQHLVTSNPSRAYVQRVAQVFAGNGSGVRGDLQAVVRAILTDPEARDDTAVTSTSFGKLREPVQRLTHWARAFGVKSPTQAWPFGDTSSSANRLAEGVGHSPSVFNWFRPGYSPPGTALSAAGRVAPEFQLATEPSVIAYVNYMQGVIPNGAGEAVPDYAALLALAPDNRALLDELNVVLAAGQVDATTVAQMKGALDTLSASSPAGLASRVYAAILLVMASPGYLVLR